MPTLIQSYNFGSVLLTENPLLFRQLSEVYTTIAQTVNTKISKYITNRAAPNTVTSDQANKNLEIGDIWINSSTDTAWIMTSRTTDLLVTWKQIT